jgi:phosphoribosylaminoimidazolecarboxamide formyltransferase/IMP cyclohydrolase
VKSEAKRTALISVTDKTDLETLAKALKNKGYRILSSSGTMKFLESKGVEAVEISSYTGSAELLDGRVKTLHPKIHAGILADRDNASHVDELDQETVFPIDLVVVNLYPFVEKYRSGKLTERELCEYIDIGGITLIRAAAKNFHHVAVVTESHEYERVAAEIGETGTTTLETRRRLASEAFALTSSYDAAIGEFFQQNLPAEKAPERMSLALEKISDLRYGENPHQYAAIYRTPSESSILSLVKHQGKELSYNNYLDLVAAFSVARDIGPGSVTIIKHTNPCGVAWCGDPLRSFHRALSTDRLSAFGGIVAANGIVEKELADELKQLFLEVVLARSFSADALDVFGKKKNLRVVSLPDSHWDIVPGSRFGLLTEGIFLYQNADVGFPELNEAEVVTKRAPTETEVEACRMAWRVAKHVKSNSIVIADEQGTVGVGAGQMSRVDSAQIATRKAYDADFSLIGKVAASDAFFPFPDGVTTLAKTGITAIIQPGGSIRDQEVIDAANAANIAMLLTGRRHFKHA